MRLPKVAVAHPCLGSGGSEIGTLQAISALKRNFDVTLITGGPVDLDRLNRYYGTSLRADEFSIRTVPMPLGLRRSAQFAGLRGAFYQRYLQQVAPEFDLMISAYNVCDFGVPGIQLIADFSFVREWRTQTHPSLANHRKWWYGNSPLRHAYLGLCDTIAGQHADGWRRNATIAKCEWAAGILRTEFGIEPKVIYPPVVFDFPPVSWEEKEAGFVCIGRVVPEKRMDAVIAILERVREAGHDVHLHILGWVDNSSFGRRLKGLSASRNWVLLEGSTFGQKKKSLAAGHRFGINGCEVDNMPNAVAEMVKVGCIPFVPSGGGQKEIVDHPALIFADDNDAVKKIKAVLSNPDLQQSLRYHLSRQALKFSVQNFQKSLREVVDEFLAEKTAHAADRPSVSEVSAA